MKASLALILLLILANTATSQDSVEQNILGTWKEGRSLINGCGDTISRFAKFQTGASGEIWKFSHPNTCTTWSFNSKGKYNRNRMTFEIVSTGTNQIIRFNGNPATDRVIIRMTKNELWVAIPSDSEKYMTFYKNKK